MTQIKHDGVITHLELDILECEVKWALGSITTKKASGGDGIPAELFQSNALPTELFWPDPAELFQILKDDAVKVLYSICQQF